MEKPEKTLAKPTRVRDSIVETPKPVLRSDFETIRVYAELLNSAPDMPFFTNMNEVTAWLDNNYNKWLRQVRSELPK